MVKNLPEVQEMWVGSLGQEDPLEKGMATRSQQSFWEIPWTEEPGGLQSMGSQSTGHNRVTNTFTFTMGNSTEIPQSMTNRATIRSTNCTSGYSFKGNKTLTPKGIYTPMSTAPLSIITEQGNNLNAH